MRIPLLTDLPDAAQRVDWSRILERDPATLYRAERRGLLKATKTRSGQVIYTKEAILDWLGLKEVEVAQPPVVELRPVGTTKRRLVPG